VIAAIALCPAVAAIQAQASPAPPAVMPVIVSNPRAAAADVESIEAIIAALYDVISGGVGQARNWNRMRSLFIPGGKLMPTIPRPDSSIGMRILGVNDYIAVSGPQLERAGFREREIARRTEQFGHIAHVWSTYEGRTETDSTVIRGINSIQLMNDGARWWVVSVFWEAERPNNPLPPRYLRNEQSTP
ncbi:MAG: hypothetical protein NUW01_09115, partial [Gemmatimonadaceae bacterium]|nr:hypothetical protein [Gemmatimonadaceae bacterium]